MAIAPLETVSLFAPTVMETVGSPRWFSSRGCVLERNGVQEVFVGGTLVGTFDDERILERNVLLVQLAEDPKCRLDRLADAFDVSTEWLRQLRRRYESGGVDQLRPKEGRRQALSDRDAARLERFFAEGFGAAAAHAKLKRGSLSTVRRAYRAWRLRRSQAPTEASATAAGSAAERTLGLPGVEMLPTRAAVNDAILDETVRGGASVQHVGTWLLIAMLVRLGLYATARQAAGERLPDDVLRSSLDATIATFAIGEPALEGVRRLRTPTAPLLLQSAVVPSPDTLRAAMDDLATDGGAIFLHFAMLRAYLESDRLAMREHNVFYIDNHMRPYTGQHVVRKGWRMQDRRVRPGCTDYYLHDVDGTAPLPDRRPVPRFAPRVGMLNIVVHVRAMLGDDEHILLAFDRGGAFPETMAALRDEVCEFVTYERAPYPKLPASAFVNELELDDETVRWTESNTNLGKGRGRVRRISVQDPDGRQINLLASSKLPAERLIEIMRGRWQQENAFKYGKERWGLNHLDARKTRAVDENEIVPNPARRRLDIARRATNIREGDARCDVAKFPEDHPKHRRGLETIEEALRVEQEIDALRATIPTRARLAETELAGKLRRHDGSRKLVLDTIRIACANAESDLAVMLARYMTKPAEAKHLLANVLRSPGQVRVGATVISVDLAPAATAAERIAIGNFLRDVSGLRLTLPGDPRRRPLKFRTQLE